MQRATPRQRRRHLRVFSNKIKRQSTPWLEKLVVKLVDRWTWDTGDPLDKKKIKVIEEELTIRNGRKYDWSVEYEHRLKANRQESQRKRRKKIRDGTNYTERMYRRNTRSDS